MKTGEKAPAAAARYLPLLAAIPIYAALAYIRVLFKYESAFGLASRIVCFAVFIVCAVCLLSIKNMLVRFAVPAALCAGLFAFAAATRASDYIPSDTVWLCFYLHVPALMLLCTIREEAAQGKKKGKAASPAAPGAVVFAFLAAAAVVLFVRLTGRRENFVFTLNGASMCLALISAFAVFCVIISVKKKASIKHAEYAPTRFFIPFAAAAFFETFVYAAVVGGSSGDVVFCAFPIFLAPVAFFDKNPAAKKILLPAEGRTKK